MKNYSAEILVLLATPTLFVVAILLGTLGRHYNGMMSAAFMSILPASLCCFAMSYRLSRKPTSPDRDADDFVEFLLGTFGTIYFIFGLLFTVALIMYLVRSV